MNNTRTLLYVNSYLFTYIVERKSIKKRRRLKYFFYYYHFTPSQLHETIVFIFYNTIGFFFSIKWCQEVI